MISAWSLSKATVRTLGGSLGGSLVSGCFPFTRFFGAGFGDCLSEAAGDAACLLPLAVLSSLGVALPFAAAGFGCALALAFALAEAFVVSFEASTSSAVA